ncbi:bifunctional 3-(3-hydroxy-phenyl)propionate/3-hydroxycinnamic acid hydroxylase [Pseudonocardia sp. KRD291]|uniref:bifunctional 3-(3-hydroxy-phenyl)propionate/3-hydroxycinnamic acid hydroxylase n=1 Tax=Pseudonocardia sp. KRD291 TaxID=2792007 RepID=UPI001C4A554F|nr:bifunctional 3-(3-hydroxy-phenyl)propionate/3-hydroxycinnamic acid hydroxylase [Pseudonocardia sp. KRD291]MBW0102630.1 bifunctional 3-(3-hydroxy-phenyl)propionate/3-hydroxycinnamic acid hydroxylase [Pseudonocardia sp. KRD291]
MEIETDVAVVGAGPCGTTLANLLGRAGVRAVVLDREPDVTPYPRAVAIDDESLRTLQTAGVIDDVLPDLIRNAPIRYHSSTGRILAHVGPSGRPYGWPRRNLFLQPLLERSLRRGLERFPHVSLHTGTEVTGLETRPDGVRLEAKAGEGRLAVAARYAIGADGGRSFLREAVGVPLEGSTAPSRWLVVDVAEDTLDAPYSAVYCDPDRPTMTIPLPYAHRRFEFKLLSGEDDDRVAGEEFVADMLRRFYPGALPRVEGRRVYWHHSRIAATFRSGPVFLAGDAAHLQPPFFGQGMNSGIRDATNLAWKLAAVTAGRAGPALLDSYDAERRGHSTAMVSFATRVGSMYQPRSRRTEVVRDGFFRAVQRIPGARDYILQMKYKPAPCYTVGAVVPGPDAGSPVGRQFGQPRMEAADGAPGLLDDILDRTGEGAGPVLAVIGLTADPADHLGTAARDRLARAGGHLFAVRPGGPAARAGASAPGRSTALVDADGAFRDLLLARPQDEVVVVRPDRYVAAACHAVELEGVLDRLHTLLGTPA